MKFIVPVTWRVWGTYEVEADSQEEAIDKVHKANYLPKDSQYIDDSLIVDYEDVAISDETADETVSNNADTDGLRRYKATVTWLMAADVEVGATNTVDAYAAAADQVNEYSLPKDGRYVMASTDVIQVELIPAAK